MSELVKSSPTWLRITEIALGALSIGLSAAVFMNPGATSLFFVTLLGIGLVLLGIARIVEGAVAPHKTKGSRVLEIIIGVAIIVAGFLSLYNPFATLAAMILFVSVLLLTFGLGLIGQAITSGKKEGRAYKIATAIIGGIVTIFALVLMTFPGLALELMIMLFAIGLFIGGWASIASGIVGGRRTKLSR